MYKKLKNLVEKSETKNGRIFELTSQALVIISLITFTIETGTELPETLTRILNILRIIIVTLFSAEYLCRLLVADSKLKFIFSFYGLVDLLAILPFYVSMGGVDFRSIRIVRLVRLLRLFKLLRYSKVLDRFRKAFSSIKDELIIFTVLAVLMLYISSVGIYYCENSVQPEIFGSITKSLWWSIVTLTTVGYGDMIPVTVVGKVFSSIIFLLGIGIIAIPTGLITSSLISVSSQENIVRMITDKDKTDPDKAD